MFSLKTIGILGGMGPSASATMYQKIIQLCQAQYGAVQDTDYPTIVLYSLPLTGFDETGIVDAPHVLQQLHSGVAKLVAAGCDCIVMACNTVHVFHSTLQAQCPVPILNIVELAAVAAAGKTVGVLASASTKQVGLYERALAKLGTTCIAPNFEEQVLITQVIAHVMGGVHGADDLHVLQGIVQDFVAHGAQTILLGCTELPLVMSAQECPMPLVNAMDVAAKAIVTFAYTGSLQNQVDHVHWK